MSTRRALVGFAGLVPDAPQARRRAGPEAPTQTLAGVGPRIAERLARLGIHTVRDAAEDLPRAFLDWGDVRGLRELRFGEEGTVERTVERISVRPTRRRNLKIVEAIVVDSTGARACAVWFNQAWLAE